MKIILTTEEMVDMLCDFIKKTEHKKLKKINNITLSPTGDGIIFDVDIKPYVKGEGILINKKVVISK